MRGLQGISALFWTLEKAGSRQPLQIFSPRLALGAPRMQALRSNSALFWAADKAGVGQPLLIFSPRLVLGTPDNARVM